MRIKANLAVAVAKDNLNQDILNSIGNSEDLEQAKEKARDAQKMLDDAQKAYEAAQAAVKVALDKLANAEQLIAPNKLAPMLQFGTLQNITEIEESLKNSGVSDENVKGMLANLNTAFGDLKAAKDVKDAAEEAKKAADDAVGKAEENQRNQIIGGDDFDDTGVTIDDQVIPLASGPVTRAEFVDYLWRHEGEPAPVEDSGLFEDVTEEHEFSPAMAWAKSVGIISAYEDGTFEPDELVTVAAVREILDNFARVFGTNAVAAADLASLSGDDDEAVLNCDEVLAEFFGEEYASTEEDEAA